MEHHNLINTINKFRTKIFRNKINDFNTHQIFGRRMRFDRGFENRNIPGTVERDRKTYVYNHATATLAMVEAYGRTGSPLLRPSAQKALDFIALCRNPYFAWRYGVKPGDNDTSVTAWAVMALKSAAKMTPMVMVPGATMSWPMVLATATPKMNGPRKWATAVTPSATRG